MHELAIAESVLATIAARTADQKVRAVCLEIGRLSGVCSDSLRFCFDLAAAEWGFDGAVLDIVEPPGRARCRSCSQEFALEDLILLCTCGSSDVRILSGDELRIVSVRVSG